MYLHIFAIMTLNNVIVFVDDIEIIYPYNVRLHVISLSSIIYSSPHFIHDQSLTANSRNVCYLSVNLLTLRSRLELSRNCVLIF